MAESKEAVALELLKLVADSEGKNITGFETHHGAWILDTYKNCLGVVNGANPRPID
jgi:CobQ-like glutamine amidotransferase family enzyme